MTGIALLCAVMPPGLFMEGARCGLFKEMTMILQDSLDYGQRNSSRPCPFNLLAGMGGLTVQTGLHRRRGAAWVLQNGTELALRSLPVCVAITSRDTVKSNDLDRTCRRSN
jgi:hypothetical protein